MTTSASRRVLYPQREIPLVERARVPVGDARRLATALQAAVLALCGERRRQVPPARHAELAVGAGEVHLDRPAGEEQSLGDLAVARAPRWPSPRPGAPAARASRRRWSAGRRGRAPVARSSSIARSVSTTDPHRFARSSPSRSGSRASRRWPPRRSAAPRSISARACATRSSEPARTSTASRARSTISPLGASSARTRSASPIGSGAPNLRAISSSSSISSSARSRSPRRAAASAA